MWILARLSAFAALDLVAGAQVSIGRFVWRIESNQAYAELGSRVASAGDVNGDGYDDLLVGAHLLDRGTNRGWAGVFHGSPAGPAKLPSWTAQDQQSPSGFGQGLGTAGDVNGDGYDDVIVGASLGSRASVYHGSPAGLETDAAWTVQSARSQFGWSVSTAGDVDGDGHDEVLVSEIGAHPRRVYLYAGSPAGLATTPAAVLEAGQGQSAFGTSVGPAGDVNGDGYDDVLVGDPLWTNGDRDEGRVLVYLGSAAGLVTTPAWTAESDRRYAYLGEWVDSAGDVDGDGYGDIIVSAENYTSPEHAEGAAFVYHGSAGGLEASPRWSFASDQVGAVGGDVGSADLDGDGYTDVVVGFHAFTADDLNEGAVFAFYGSAGGLAATPGWMLQGNQRNCRFGFAVSGAGDVNGDGFEDVVVGAPRFDAPDFSEGRAFAYLGAPRQRVP
jgi:hypothetical protein